MSKNSVVTIGVFDGVHIGHKAVIKKAAQRARATGAKSAVVTFDPHPLKVLDPGHFVPSLISLKHRVRLVKELGIDKVYVMKFGKKIAGMSAEKFVKDILVKKLKAKEIFVGEDFYFGRDAKAGVDKLKKIAADFGFKVRVVRPVKIDKEIVSSSTIRRCIVRGKLDKAAKFLGRRVSVMGTVVSGSKLGRILGYPTANINPHHEVVPPSGVYAVRIKFNNRLYRGVLNIGTRPTFYNHGRDEEPAMEVYIFNFRRNIYNKDIEVFFVRKIRDEKRFNSETDLIEQIRKDVKIFSKIKI